MLDGSVHVFKALVPLLSPTGRAAALIDDGLFSESCDAVAENHRIRIRDLDSETESAVVTSDRSLAPVEWSPSGDQLLYTSYSTRASKDQGCTSERDPASAQSFLLPLRGGEAIAVPNVHALRQEWYGLRLVEFRCVDGSETNLFGQCADGKLALFVGGHLIATDGRPVVLGFVDPPVP